MGKAAEVCLNDTGDKLVKQNIKLVWKKKGMGYS